MTPSSITTVYDEFVFIVWITEDEKEGEK